MADGGCSSKNPSRRVRMKPTDDAEKHIKLKTDKAGLEQVFVNPYKGKCLYTLTSFPTCSYLFECKRWTTGLVDTSIPLTYPACFSFFS